MIISLEKLINVKGNKYTFSNAANTAIDRKDNIKDYPHGNVRSWKVVPHVLEMILNGKIKYVEKKNGE
jgi:hypothetical protein